MSWHYRAYGLHIRSDFPCPLVAGQTIDPVDVDITLGPVKEHLAQPEHTRPWYEINEHELLLKFPEIGKFHIENGQRITIDRRHPDIEHILIYLLGSAMSGLLQQRGFLLLHANSIVIQDASILVMAPPGTGKSTLTAAFLNKGYRLLADDLSALMIQDNHIVAYPGYPQIKLCPDVFPYFNFQASQLKRLPIQIRQQDKYYVRLEQEYYPEPLPCQHIIVLAQANATENPGWHYLDGYQKFKALLDHAHAALMYKPKWIELKQFKKCSLLSKKIPMVRLIRPNHYFSAFDLVDEIVNLVTRKKWIASS